MEKLILECIADGLDNYVMDFTPAGPPPVGANWVDEGANNWVDEGADPWTDS